MLFCLYYTYSACDTVCQEATAKKNNKKSEKNLPPASCNLKIQHYINSIEDGEKSIDSSRKREGTELWTYGLTLNYLQGRKWFNVKPSHQNGLMLNYFSQNGLTLNRPPKPV